MIDCIFEPMSVAAARTHFSEPVENELRLKGYFKEASLCKDIREWWRAEDDRGIPAKTRIAMRMSLRKRLMSYVDFSRFPPPGMFIKGWPSQLWEALIANIDAKVLLYYICEKKTYNVRAFSSIMGETYFAELTLNDRRGHGTVTVDEFGLFINNSVEQLHMRIDPNRKFAYRTSRKHVYDLVDRDDICDQIQPLENLPEPECVDDIRDHSFDREECHRKSKNKEANIVCERNAIKRGSLGVRWETARRNEGKLLPTLRLGIDI